MTQTTTPRDEAVLKAGWLKRDTAKAAARVAEWSTNKEPAMNVHEYVDGYEFRGDQDYTPNDDEKVLIEDAIHGYLAMIAPVAEIRRAASALINNLWVGVYSGSRTFEENWRVFERDYPGVKWLYDALKAPDLSPAATPVSEAGGEAITARYTNWRGETAERTFIPHRVFSGSNEWHPEPQVLIEATDCEKGALRTFAAAGFAIAKPAAVGDVREATPAMVVAAFKVLPPDAEMGVGEMERLLNAALAARSQPEPNAAEAREADTLSRAADIVERLPWYNAETIARRMRAAAANHKAAAHG